MENSIIKKRPILDFLEKRASRIIFIITLGFVLAVNLYLRSLPVNFPQLKEQARSIVRQIVQQQAMAEVQKRFPQFYYSAKDAIVQSEIKQYYKFNKANIKIQTENIYKNLKNKFQDDTGQTYLMELDCWHWARYVENVVKFGHPGDEVIDGKQWDRLMLAPKGDFLSWGQLLFYLSAFLYKAVSPFIALPLFTFLFYLPLFFTCIFIIALFMFSFKYGSYIAGSLSCLFTGLAPVFLPRSCAGWFDMDILNLLFPILIVWAYLLSIEKPSRKEKFFWIFISAFFLGLFAATWAFWWFILLVILIYEFVSWGWLLLLHFYSRSLFRQKALSAPQGQHIGWPFNEESLRVLLSRIKYVTVFLVFSFLWILLVAGIDPVIELCNQLKKSFILNKPLMDSIWPNVYSTVGELRRSSINEIGQTVGARWIALCSFFCMVMLGGRAVLSKTLPDYQRAAIGIFVIWFLAMVFAASRGVRFTVFLLVPLAISLGWGINDVCHYLRIKSRPLSVVFTGVVPFILCLAMITKGSVVAGSIYPLIDDAWYRVLTLVKEKTPQETIINSWWDFGDWFKVVASRRVIFDGQTQHTPQAYWMAKALLSNDENQAVAILRMLNNGGNKAFEIINEYIKDPLQAVLLLEHLIPLPQEKAQQVLLKFLPESAAINVKKMLFSPPAKAVFVVDHSMPYKMPAISYLGNWNFSKVYIAQNLNKIEKNRIIEYLKDLKGDEQQIHRFYQEAFLISQKNLNEWLSQRLQVYSQLLNGKVKDDIVSFDNGFAYNIKDGDIQSNAGQIPRSVFTLVNDSLVETVSPQANVPFSVLIYETKDGYKSILLDRELAGSLFVRLYFLGGRGLRHFIPFVESEEGNNYISFFSIVW